MPLLEWIGHRRHLGRRQLVGQHLLFQLRQHVAQQFLQLPGQGKTRFVQGQVDVAADADAVDTVFDAQAADVAHIACMGIQDEFLCSMGFPLKGIIFWACHESWANSACAAFAAAPVAVADENRLRHASGAGLFPVRLIRYSARPNAPSSGKSCPWSQSVILAICLSP